MNYEKINQFILSNVESNKTIAASFIARMTEEQLNGWLGSIYKLYYDFHKSGIPIGGLWVQISFSDIAYLSISVHGDDGMIDITDTWSISESHDFHESFDFDTEGELQERRVIEKHNGEVQALFGKLYK